MRPLTPFRLDRSVSAHVPDALPKITYVAPAYQPTVKACGAPTIRSGNPSPLRSAEATDQLAPELTGRSLILKPLDPFRVDTSRFAAKPDCLP